MSRVTAPRDDEQLPSTQSRKLAWALAGLVVAVIIALGFTWWLDVILTGASIKPESQGWFDLPMFLVFLALTLVAWVGYLLDRRT